jgi:hypothetical protein
MILQKYVSYRHVNEPQTLASNKRTNMPFYLLCSMYSKVTDLPRRNFETAYILKIETFPPM